VGSRRDRVLLLALAAILVVLSILLAPSEGESPLDFRPSTFHNADHGARALYLTLEELGIEVDRRFAAFMDDDSLAGPLVLLAPGQSPTPTELGVLRDWVEHGGTLVYAARPYDTTLDTLGLALTSLASDSLEEEEAFYWPGRKATPDHHAWTRGTLPVEGFRWAFADTAAAFRGPLTQLVSTSSGDAVVVSYPLGEGRVIAWSDAAPLTNRRLRRSGAAPLFARIAAEVTPEGGALHFDEYHHGYRGGGSPVKATLRFLRDTGPGRMALQLALVGLGALLLLGRRFGAPLPPPPARRRSPLEHVEALAGAYRRAGARATARRLLLAGLARRLGRGPHEVRDERRFLERLGTHLPVGQEAARGVREEFGRGERADLVALSRGIDQLLEEVKRT
jgi:hypothetical protein